ncbi:cyclic nucleotide-binding domain-containing protein [Glaciecola sp. SC05]|uniref:cyclic nucleotide-binding domain-containing protein n=1 Tax=Glaciecola sp. SC05 TaxID=1987355 RepID=UPI0035287D28
MARSQIDTLAAFKAKGEHNRLKSTLLRNGLIGNDDAIVSFVIENHSLIEYSKGDFVITEGADDDDVYFILAGDVEIISGKRVIDKKSSPSTVGEMAANKAGELRSADVVVKSNTLICAKITSSTFRTIQKEFPQFSVRLSDETEISYRRKIRQLSMWEKEEFSWFGICAIVSALIGCGSGILSWQYGLSVTTIAVVSLVSASAAFVLLMLSNPLFAYRRIFQLSAYSMVTLVFYKISSVAFELKEITLPFSLNVNIGPNFSTTEFAFSILGLLLLCLLAAYRDGKFDGK